MVCLGSLSNALPYAYSGFETIVDFSIPPWFLETAKKIVSVRDVHLDYVVVRPTEEVSALWAVFINPHKAGN